MLYLFSETFISFSKVGGYFTPVGHKGSTAKTTCVVSVSLTTATPHLPQTDNNPDK
jgi:hypothetical protein